jgi:hypothetical protein
MAAAVSSKPAIVGKPVVLGQPVVTGEAVAATKEATEPPARSAPQDIAPHVNAPYEIAVPSSRAAGPVDGLGPWTRCFTEALRPAGTPAAPEAPTSWRMHTAPSGPMLAEVSSIFTADPAAGRTLAIVADPADERSRSTAIEAARDAITTGELVVLTTSAQFTGFFAGLHAEHPSIGVTVLRVPADGVSAEAIRQFAIADVGQFRELVLDTTGLASEPVLAEVALAGGGDFPLGPSDVILVSRSTGGAGLALAQVLACCGAGVAVVGRAGEHDDTELVAGMEELRSAGARIGYEVIDIDDQASLAAAVRRIEDRLGKVTALAHGASEDDHVPFLELTDAQIRMQLADEIRTLDLMAGSIRPGQLKLIISFGTVADRYGLAGASKHALSSGALASQAARLADASLGCQHLHLDMPAWSTGGLGDRPELAAELAAADSPALDLGAASRMLLKLMSTPGRPASVALHGRVGGLAASAAPVITRAELSAAGLARGGRFLREVAVHYPGIELICSARLTLASDPYLADYRIDGMPVLPSVLALEALAQAASVLAGRPLRRAVEVTLESPVLIPSGGEAVLRICALRDGDRIVAVLRCADSSYRVDHARAEFSAPGQPDMPEVAAAAASPALQQLVAGPSDLVDGAELYGPISFQSGRFRRIALLPEVTARSGRALARGADEHPWYPVGSELASTEFLLGSPGLNDAALQVLQACVPHRRVRPAGCDSVQFSGRGTEGPIEIRAVAEPIRSVAATGADPVAIADPITGADPVAMASPEVAPPGRSEPPLVPGQAGAPEAETTGRSALASRTGDAAPGKRTAAAVQHEDLTPEELADMEVAERRPQQRKSRKSRRSAGDRSSEHRSNASYSAMHTWEVPQSALGRPATGSAVEAPVTKADEAGAAAQPLSGTQSPPATARRAPQPLAAPAPQLWNIEAVDADGQLIATWRGVRLHDSGPLPRNAAWPATLLSVFLERSAVDLGLDEGLRVTVSCEQPDDLLPNAATAVPRQSPPGNGRPSGGGRHAGPERRAMNTATAPGTGALAGFGLTLRAPVPVACGWAAVELGRRPHEMRPGMASAYAQLREELAESPAVLAARLEAVSACMAMADIVADDRSADRLTIVQTTGDGWAVFALGRALIACAVVEVSGLSAPVAIAILTRKYAHARSTVSRAAAPVSRS